MDMDRANWDFYSKTLRGAIVQRALGKTFHPYSELDVREALGKLYVAEKFPPEAKAQMKELVGNLVKAYEKRINDLAWMDAETKAKAIEKLEKTNVKVGYPDQWKDYSSLNLTNAEGEASYFDAMLNVAAFEFAENIAELGEPVDKSKWYMSPQTVNAYYNPPYNEIVFPAAILQPPFFDFTADAAVNYGGIGRSLVTKSLTVSTTIRADYDAYGNLVNWWTDKTWKSSIRLAKNLPINTVPLKSYRIPLSMVSSPLENIGDLGEFTLHLTPWRYTIKITESQKPSMAFRPKTFLPFMGYHFGVQKSAMKP